ncbi:MAG: signal peptidase I, partial [Clostridia bacterium]|nr:signal peptidase I [Clostridia bacterium]
MTAAFGKVYMNVMSDSMEPTFSKGDVLIANEYKGDGTDLKVGQVITFKTSIMIGGQQFDSFNTHRIIKITNSSSGLTIYTRGDNQKNPDGSYQDWHDYVDSQEGTKVDRAIYDYEIEKIVAVWGDVDENLNFTPGKMLKGAGLLSNWLQEPGKNTQARFFCIIVLPLIILFVAYAFVLVRTLVIAKIEKEKAVVADTTVTVDSLSDEEKRRLAEEYLASLKAQQDGGDVPAADDSNDEPKADNAPSEDLKEEPKGDDADDASSENPTETL